MTVYLGPSPHHLEPFYLPLKRVLYTPVATLPVSRCVWTLPLAVDRGLAVVITCRFGLRS